MIVLKILAILLGLAFILFGYFIYFRKKHNLINHPEKIVNKTYLAMMERLGYDVRLVYEKRETSE